MQNITTITTMSLNRYLVHSTRVTFWVSFQMTTGRTATRKVLPFGKSLLPGPAEAVPVTVMDPGDDASCPYVELVFMRSARRPVRAGPHVVGFA